MGYPVGEPYERGTVGVGGGHAVYWETRGNPRAGAPSTAALAPGARRRGPSCSTPLRTGSSSSTSSCGRSTPHASEPDIELSANTTHHLVADMELLWLEDGALLAQATALAETPGVLVDGRFDFQARSPTRGSSGARGRARSSSSSTTPGTAWTRA